MILVALSASLLENMLASNSVVRDTEEKIRKSKWDRIFNVGSSFN